MKVTGIPIAVGAFGMTPERHENDQPDYSTVNIS